MGGLIRSKEELNERFFNTNRAALRDQVGANDDFGRSDLWRRHGPSWKTSDSARNYYAGPCRN